MNGAYAASPKPRCEQVRTRYSRGGKSNPSRTALGTVTWLWAAVFPFTQSQQKAIHES